MDYAALGNTEGVPHDHSLGVDRCWDPACWVETDPDHYCVVVAWGSGFTCDCPAHTLLP